jgi:hypothetical protein
MSNRVATMANRTVQLPTDISEITERDFILPKPAELPDNHLAPPTISSLGLALQQANMIQRDGLPFTRSESGTPPSATSTAPGSPRLYVSFYLCSNQNALSSRKLNRTHTWPICHLPVLALLRSPIAPLAPSPLLYCNIC